MLSTSFSVEIDKMLVFCYFVTVNYKTPQNKWLKSIIAKYNLGIISKNIGLLVLHHNGNQSYFSLPQTLL